MFFAALATDYDGTLAQHGQVDGATRRAIEEIRQSGRKLILVTGRTLTDLASAFGKLVILLTCWKLGGQRANIMRSLPDGRL